MATYSCSQVASAPSADGSVACLSWVVQSSALDSLALSGDDAIAIGGAIIGCFTVIIAFMIIAKAAKLM